MKSFLGFVLFLVVGYFLAPIVTTLLLIIFKNGIIGGVNLAHIIWYYLQLGWEYFIFKAGLLDTLVCILPFKPIVNWSIFGAIIAFVIAFLFSVKGLRRSYLKMNLIFLFSALVLLSVYIFTSNNLYSSYKNIEDDLKANLQFGFELIKNEDGTELLNLPAPDSKTLMKMNKNYKIFIDTLTSTEKWCKAKYIDLREDEIDGYVDRNHVFKAIIAYIEPPNGANIRSGPGTNYRIVRKLAHNYPIILISTNNNWHFVEFQEGERTNEGYIHNSCISFSDNARIQPGNSNIPDTEPIENYSYNGSMILLGAETCKAVENLEPINITSNFSVLDRVVYCWTNIRNGQGRYIKHIYYCNGDRLYDDIVRLNIRSNQRYRCYSRKNIWRGEWKIQIVDDQGIIMRELLFNVR